MRAAALRKLRGSTVDLSKHELEVLAQQIRADLDRIGGGTGAASSSHTAGTTANGCHDGHGQAARAGNPTERSTAGRDERNFDGTQYERIEVQSETIRVAGPQDPPQGATLRRTSDVMENPSSSNGVLTSSHRTGSIASSWRKSTTPPRKLTIASPSVTGINAITSRCWTPEFDSRAESPKSRPISSRTTNCSHDLRTLSYYWHS